MSASACLRCGRIQTHPDSPGGEGQPLQILLFLLLAIGFESIKKLRE